MPTKPNYMYGQQANALMNTSEREPYWDYMARRGAGKGTMINTGTITITDEVDDTKKDFLILKNNWGNSEIEEEELKVSAAVSKNEALAKSTIQSSHSSMAEAVNHPPHYNKGIETTQYIKSWDMNWNQANVVKYVSRYNLKNKHDVNLQIQDLMKAKWYLEDLIKELEKQNPY
tara:strand:- start:11684 stop:12205 length:522 start_codon:yes stop_codon:yes gene_type:complete